MTDDPILQRALERRDAAARELERISDFVRLYEELRGQTFLCVKRTRRAV
jgi:hypothetical protein